MKSCAGDRNIERELRHHRTITAILMASLCLIRGSDT